MIKRKRAAEIVGLLRELDLVFESYEAGDRCVVGDVAPVMEKLSEIVGELRDALWHEVPSELGDVMDLEDGLPLDRGQPR